MPATVVLSRSMMVLPVTRQLTAKGGAWVDSVVSRLTKGKTWYWASMELKKAIKLVQSIPFHVSSGSGEIIAIEGSVFVVRWNQGSTFETGRSATITIPWSQGHHWTFEGVMHQVADFRWEFHGENKHRLSDFIGQLRKSQHIEICRVHDVEDKDRCTGFEDFSLLPEALPELDYADIDCARTFLGRQFLFPVLITGMTGGTREGLEINRRLAAAAAKFGIPMGIGSQRLALENSDFVPVFDVKKAQPDIFLIGNVGISQLLGPDPVGLAQRAVDMVAADALAIHCNVLQECVQPEGDRSFRGVVSQIKNIATELSVPVIVKEVGSGLSLGTIARLQAAGVAAMDLGGRGGTSWGYIEGLRSADRYRAHIGEVFREWGIPTAYNLRAAVGNYPDIPFVATGGIRNGLMVAKACGLGATMVGVGLPLMQAALVSEEVLMQTCERIFTELRIGMLVSGCRTLEDLPAKISEGLPYRPYSNNEMTENKIIIDRNISSEGRKPSYSTDLRN